MRNKELSHWPCKNTPVVCDGMVNPEGGITNYPTRREKEKHREKKNIQFLTKKDKQ